MSRGKDLKRSMDDLRRGVKRTVEEAIANSGEAEGETHNINVARRVNKAIVTNVGEPGSVQGASSKQKVRIRQDEHGTYEEAETTNTTF